MSNRAWVRRRTKRGLAARQMDAISRAMRRDRNKPLPQSWTRRGHGISLTVTVGPREMEGLTPSMEIEDEIQDWP